MITRFIIKWSNNDLQRSVAISGNQQQSNTDQITLKYNHKSDKKATGYACSFFSLILQKWYN